MIEDSIQLCKYLKEANFNSFMECWKKQYERLGHVGGTISVALNDENKEDIAGFIGKDYHLQSHAKIRYSEIKKAIINSRYETADFEEVLFLYYDHKIISNKNSKEQKDEICKHFFENLLSEYKETKAYEWLDSCIQLEDSMYIRIKQEIFNDSKKIDKTMHYVMSAINVFPVWNKTVETMPIFAARITNDPHMFDYNRLANLLLFHAACFCLDIPYRNGSQLDKNIVFNQVGLYQENVNNYCMISRINALDLKGNLHQGWNGFYEKFEMWNVNSHNLQQISKIDCEYCDAIYIVENPSVFHELCLFAKHSKIDNIGFVCTNGILNMCGYQLLDLINKAKISMYYCGDFDPEGLMIADRLLNQFELLNLWCYEIEGARKTMFKKHINQRRINMLNLLKNPLTIAIKELIIEGYIGYQENMMDIYKSELIKRKLVNE